LDERQGADERADGRLDAGSELNVDAVRLEVLGHPDSVHLAGEHPAECRERLQRLAIGVVGARRIDRDEVPRPEPLHGGLLAVIELNEPASDAPLHMGARDDTDPVVGHGVSMIAWWSGGDDTQGLLTPWWQQRIARREAKRGCALEGVSSTRRAEAGRRRGANR